MFDFTGVSFGFTVAERLERRLSLEFCREDGEAFDVGDVTFALRLYDADGAEMAGARAEHGLKPGSVTLDVPALEAGRYGYELVARAASGEEDVLVRGAVTALARVAGEQIVKEAGEAALAALAVRVPGAAGAPLTLKWRGGSYAAGYVEEARKSAQEAEAARQEAEAAAERADEKSRETGELAARVLALEGVIALVEGRIQSAIVIDPETNTWRIGGVDTGIPATGEPGKSPRVSDHNTWELYDPVAQVWYDSGKPVSGADGKSPYVDAEGFVVDVDPLTGEFRRTDICVRGRDGLDGTSVVRHIIGGREELPEAGETCHGGHYYYVPLSDAWPVAVFEPLEGRSWAGEISINGVPVSMPGAGLEPVSAVSQLAESLREVFPEAEVETRGAAVALRGDVQAWTVSGLDEEAWRLTLHVRMPRKGFDVYAWLVQQDGSAGWVCVGEANDIATAEIYGLTKLSTDVPVTGGAPVGVDRQGGMRVPAAEWAMRGCVLPGEAGAVEGGAGVGFDADGRMRVREGDRDHYGVARTSYAGVAEVPCIGRMADGRWGLPWATLTVPGAMKLGSMFDEHVQIPYRVGVGATANHELANNLLVGGALQHQKPGEWRLKEMEWLDGAGLKDSAYYLGLVTSNQFSQSQQEGLTLLSATVERIGGVHLAFDLQDAREDAVPTAASTLGYLEANYYGKSEVYSRSAADARFATKDETTAAYETKAAAEERERRILEALDTKVSKTPQWTGNVYLTEEEYRALEVIDPTIEYNILGKSR